MQNNLSLVLQDPMLHIKLRILDDELKRAERKLMSVSHIQQMKKFQAWEKEITTMVAAMLKVHEPREEEGEGKFNVT